MSSLRVSSIRRDYLNYSIKRNTWPSASKNSPPIGVKLGLGSEVRLLSQFHIFLILFTPSSRWKIFFFQSSFFPRWQIPNLITGLSIGARWWPQTRNFGPAAQEWKLHLKRHWSSCIGSVLQKQGILTYLESYFSNLGLRYLQSWALFVCLGGTHPDV